MKMMNLGCGPDIKEGWDNVDVDRQDPKVMTWDARYPLPIEPRYDFVLINHMLCTMSPVDVARVLDNVYSIMVDGSIIEVIDLNLWSAIDAYQRADPRAIPASGQTIDEQLCNHISGFGTRKSLYTPKLMTELLERHGFRDVRVMSISRHDLRPGESLILRAKK